MLHTGAKPQWLKEVEAQRKSYTVGGIIYQENQDTGHQCLIVKDYLNLIAGAEDYNELLCASNDVIIDLGDASQGHDLIINVEGGKVYINGHAFTGMTGLICLGDGSWGIVFQDTPLKPKSRNALIEWLAKIYELWLDEVYKRSNCLGLIELNRFHEMSIRHLIIDNLPKGKIISKKVQISS